jgi:type I restriction enzyme, S subunit
MSWRTVTIGELVDNFSVRAKDHDSDTSELEFCGVSNEEGITKSKYAAEDKAEDYKIIEKDCFAYNPYRINVGSIGLLEDDTVGLISPAYVVFKPKPRSIIPQLLLKFLKSAEGLRQIKLYARGTVRQALRFEDLCKIELAIPNYEEQLDFFKRIEETEIESKEISFQLTHQLDLVKHLRQAFLREAMQGQLVPQDENDEHASVLLEKIKAEKARLIKEKKIKKQKPLPPITEDEIPFGIPDNWVWCRLGELAEFRRGPFGSALTKGIFVKEGYKVYEQRNAIYDDHTLGDYFVTAEKFAEMQSFVVQPLDLIVSCSGATLGRIAEIPKGAREGIINQALMRIRLYMAAIRNDFYIKLFRSPYMQELIFKKAWGTAIPNMVGLSDIKEILIPLPPLTEQQRIVTKLDELMAYCDELEASIKESQQQNELLLQQVLREALEPKEKEVVG